MAATVRQQPLDVLGDDVDLEVDPIAGLTGAEGGPRQRLGDQADREPVGAGLDDRQADAVDGDRALVDEVAAETVGQGDLDDLPVLAGLPAYDGPGAVDVSLNDVAAETRCRSDGALEINRRARFQTSERRAQQCFA